MNYDDLTREELIAVLQRRDALARYGLRWERDSIPQDKSLNRDFVGFELDEERSVGEGPWTNLVVEGDNFDALRHLATTHPGKVQVIYVDPPYNTGRKDFVYNDNYFDATNRYRHSAWLEFMYQRMSLAKHLLSDDGTIFVSIDDIELYNLKLLMDSVFGAQNFIGNIVWNNVTDNNPTRVAIEHEYILVYAKQKALNPPIWKSPDFAIKELLLEVGHKLIDQYDDQDALQKAYTEWYRENKAFLGPMADYKFIDHKGVYAGSRSVHNPGKEGYRYDVPHPVTGKPCKEPLMGYRFPWKTMQALIENDELLYGEDENKIIELKVYAKDFLAKLPSVIELDGRKGPNELKSIFGGVAPFNNPKPSELITHLLSFVANKDALVMDFFAGSGTTAHAVMQLNKEDGGNRSFILVSSKEATVEEPDKNICKDVCAARITKVIEGYQSSDGERVPGLGGNFAYVKATRVPMHRLEEGLTDSMVWMFALQACRHPLTAATPGLSVSTRGEHMVAYCSNVKTATLEKLEAAIARHSGVAVVLTWAPAVVAERLAENMHRIRLVSVPHDIRRSFKQGNVRDAQEQQPDSQEENQGESA
ncbi:site-specific DNA-methyltransferase [Ralstonia solanacearum]|nr:site-specific DNA-methyltransferase [Ralstonia solanacearum]